MRIRIHHRAGQVLLIVLAITAGVGIVLASYLKLTQSQNRFTARSQTWNNCIAVLEAGVEDALAQLNYSANSNLTASGWTATTGGFYKNAAIGEGGYKCMITYTNIIYPTITVTGYLAAPLTLASSGNALMATAFTPDPTVKYITRMVRVTARKEPALSKGMVVKDSIDLNGNSCTIDSYDSTVGTYLAATARDKGDVAINADLVNVGSLGNAKIKGHLSTGPKATYKIGPNGVVGSVAWHAAGNKGIQSGWLRRDMNFNFPSVGAPWSGGALTPTGNGTFDYVMDTGNYELNVLNISSTQKIYIKGQTVLYVKGNVTITGQIKVNPGATLVLYCGGSFVTLSGTYDKADIPKEFMVYCLPTVKTVTISGTALVLYAPEAKLVLSGSGEYYGASVSQAVTMNGSTGFHYDEALAREPLYKQYVITSWNEL